MSSVVVTTYTCDKCKKTEQTTEYHIEGWSVWYIEHKDKDKEWYRDICAECTARLEAA